MKIKNNEYSTKMNNIHKIMHKYTKKQVHFDKNINICGKKC